MKVSFNQPYEKVKDNNGYGYAAKMCKQSLVTLGHEVSWRDPTADVEINFIQPEHWEWSGVDYRIAYLPWESTALPEGWAKALNSVDEVWTPSPFIAEVFRDNGVKVPVKVYEHGVDNVWSPVVRNLAGKLNVLHHGAEALRKGSTEAVAAVDAVFSPDEAHLHLKCNLPFGFNTPKVTYHNTLVPLDELVGLYHNSDLFLYPSWGEGFGLTPLQAMATGMPVLITKGWAPYESFLYEHNLIKSTLVDSPWPDIHPGQMFRPDPDDIEDKLRYFKHSREFSLFDAEFTGKMVSAHYDWVKMTENAFSHLL